MGDNRIFLNRMEENLSTKIVYSCNKQGLNLFHYILIYIRMSGGDKFYVYIHVCCMNNWKEVVGDIFSDIKQSGLYEKLNEIRCFVLSHNLEEDLAFFDDKKTKIIGSSTDFNLYESCTINALHEDALVDGGLDHDMKTNNTYVLYLHSKGVTKPHDEGVKDWVKCLKHFNIYKHGECIQKLMDGYDVVGINFHLTPKYHFSGNFWWTSYQHLRSLDRLVFDNYLSPEMWVCSNSKGLYYCSFHSRVDHYQQRYDESNYV